MGVAGIGSALASVGSQYDFTKLTNKQLYDAANKLGSEGKISHADAAQLSFIAQGVDSVPISGSSPSVGQILSDPTQHDFISELQGDDNSAHAPGAVGAALFDSLLNDLKTAYQSSSLVDNSKLLSTQA